MYEERLAKAWEAYTSTNTRKDDLRHALYLALETARYYKEKAEKAEPLMSAVRNLVEDMIDDRRDT